MLSIYIINKIRNKIVKMIDLDSVIDIIFIGNDVKMDSLDICRLKFRLKFRHLIFSAKNRAVRIFTEKQRKTRQKRTTDVIEIL